MSNTTENAGEGKSRYLDPTLISVSAMAKWFRCTNEAVRILWTRHPELDLSIPVKIQRPGIGGGPAYHHTFADFYSIARFWRSTDCAFQNRIARLNAERAIAQAAIPIAWGVLPQLDATPTEEQLAYTNALQILLEDTRRQDINRSMEPAAALHHVLQVYEAHALTKASNT